MKRHSGFTVIEVLVVLVVLIGAGSLFLSQKSTFDAINRDNQRKTAINAMYYSLEEAYYPEKKHYPQTIDSKTLRTVDPALFTDPDGYVLGDPNSNYRYESSDCSLDGKCGSYIIYSTMEREETFERKSRR